MHDKERSAIVTVVNVLGLSGVNYWLGLHGGGMLNYLFLWPIAMAWCVFIAARIWHGHNTL